jgi:hypothetical protein
MLHTGPICQKCDYYPANRLALFRFRKATGELVFLFEALVSGRNAPGMLILNFILTLSSWALFSATQRYTVSCISAQL